MIGYNDTEENYLNQLFKLNCKSEDELSIRHSLVNLMAMIILGGKENFLWTFAFQPLLLQDTYVQNLAGPILSRHAITNQDVVDRMAGTEDRTRVCHFVRARLLSTMSFLSIRSNRDDACIILNRCFEQFAFLTLQQQSWIKSVFVTHQDKLQADQEYQNEIFYFVYEQLPQYKYYINNLYLQSQIQSNLQNFVASSPVCIKYLHFTTNLNNPLNSKLPLMLLHHILNSRDFLKMTSSIYHLSRFYLLLHQTYTQLVEQEEFSTVTLRQLFELGNQQHKEPDSFDIIENGIQAVNNYHQFSSGLIQPGGCDETQRFTSISLDTPVSYLTTTENHDESDIIMRILR
ncbi:unnamed protein product [Didymodactylos carnosus]|uniref:Uncharacterized protein n=2 Tax=Didymodactylos carnosus TaxID=1234261 RepID=A0A8S2K766_9BILA|nr:unnamed protein product [Didymodactylos carnosus]CAF3828639.1 unnamed protein product [Didymodactylos carnosus]